MKRIWEWIQENSTALQGVAALVVVIGALIAIQSYVSKAIRPDVVIRLNIDVSTVPPDLIDFNKDVSRLFNLKGYEFEELKGSKRLLADLLNNPVAKRLDTWGNPFDKARIEIINQSEDVISGLRLRLDNVFNYWGFEISGTYLEPAEAAKFKDLFSEDVSNKTIIFPELPTMPPNSSLEIIIYGDIDSLNPSITAVGQSYIIKNVVEVEDGFFIDIYENPYRYLAVAIGFTPLFLVVLSLIWAKVRKRVIVNETKYVFYNRACELAVEGDAENAIVLLRQAVDAGYDNFKHALKDDDLESLKEREDFSSLFKEG